MKNYIKLCVTIVVLAFSTMTIAQISIGYVTKSATNAGWMMINQGAADAANEGRSESNNCRPFFSR